VRFSLTYPCSFQTNLPAEVKFSPSRSRPFTKFCFFLFFFSPKVGYPPHFRPVHFLPKHPAAVSGPLHRHPFLGIAACAISCFTSFPRFFFLVFLLLNTLSCPLRPPTFGRSCVGPFSFLFFFFFWLGEPYTLEGRYFSGPFRTWWQKLIKQFPLVPPLPHVIFFNGTPWRDFQSPSSQRLTEGHPFSPPKPSPPRRSVWFTHNRLLLFSTTPQLFCNPPPLCLFPAF